MSSLWMEAQNLSYNILLKEPSPMCNSLLHNFRIGPCIEEIYLLISCPGGKKRNSRGSMTVEAAVVVPLLILFILHLGSCMEMLRLHGRLEYALWQTGHELAVYGAVQNRNIDAGTITGDVSNMAPGTVTDDVLDIAPNTIMDNAIGITSNTTLDNSYGKSKSSSAALDLAVSYLYVNGRIGQILGRDYLDSSPLARGHQGLNYLASEYLEGDECINIILTYQVCPQITCFPFPYFRMASRYYGRAWTGFDVGGGAERVTYVYVTEDGEVWHSRGDCSYIKLSVCEAQAETVWMLRNASGERYRPCSRCKNQLLEGVVYLTQEGNRYHSVRSCPSLMRRVHAIVWQENMPYRPCSRCAASR